MQNPFTIGIVEGSNFCDREKKLRELKNYASNQENIVLYSPGRYGKYASLIIKILSGLIKENLGRLFLSNITTFSLEISII